MSTEAIGDATGLVTALGLFIVAIGVALGKIAGCLTDLRRQAHRLSAETRMHDSASSADMADVRRQLAGIRMLVMTRADYTDARLEEQQTRLARLETNTHGRRSQAQEKDTTRTI